MSRKIDHCLGNSILQTKSEEDGMKIRNLWECLFLRGAVQGLREHYLFDVFLGTHYTDFTERIKERAVFSV